jgi:AcrR family transcriptional regulator
VPKTRHELDRSAKVTELLDVAERLFNERGYGGTTTAALADAAGVAQNAVYWYFPSKDDLFVGVLERMLDRLVRDIAKVRRRPLVDQVLFTIDRLEQTQDLGAALAERARTSEVAAAFRDRMGATLRATLAEAIARESPNADQQLLADTILAIANGTHGMPKPARRRLVTFGVNGLLEAQRINARATPRSRR